MTTPVAVKALHHYGLTVSSLADAKAWYARTLGLRPGAEWSIAAGKIRIALMEGPGFAVELFETDAPRPDATRGEDVATSLTAMGLRHVALRVADVAATHETLTAMGVTIASAPAHSDAGFFYCFALDPDGNQIEFVEPD